MTKVQIKPEKFTPVGGLFYVANQFMHHIMPHVDNYLGRRSQLVGYQYGEILLTMASNFFSGTPVKFHQEDTLERILLNIIEQGVKIRSTRVDGGEDIYVYRAILTNEWDMDEEAAIDFYNQRGAKEKLFD